MQRGVTYVEDRSGAEGTSRRKQKMIISLTVRQAVSLKEVASSQRLFTVNTDEMLWMPEASQCSNHLNITIIIIINTTKMMSCASNSHYQKDVP